MGGNSSATFPLCKCLGANLAGGTCFAPVSDARWFSGLWVKMEVVSPLDSNQRSQGCRFRRGKAVSKKKVHAPFGPGVDPVANHSPVGKRHQGALVSSRCFRAFRASSAQGPPLGRRRKAEEGRLPALPRLKESIPPHPHCEWALLHERGGTGCRHEQQRWLLPAGLSPEPRHPEPAASAAKPWRHPVAVGFDRFPKRAISEESRALGA